MKTLSELENEKKQLDAEYDSALEEQRALGRNAAYTPRYAKVNAEMENLESLISLAKSMERIRRPAFRPRCQCGGYNGVSADRKSCNDCRD